MRTTEKYRIWPRDLPWSTKFAAVETLIHSRGYSTMESRSVFLISESVFRSHRADSFHEFVELLRLHPYFESFNTSMFFKENDTPGSEPTLRIEIEYEGSQIIVLVDSANQDVAAGIIRRIADELCLSNPPPPPREAHRARYLQPTIFVGRHFDEESDSAYRLLSTYLTLLGFVVLQGEEYSSREIPEKVRSRIDRQEIFIALITGQRDHAWLQAEPAYAKGRGKHIILIVQEDSGYNPTILGTDLEQIRFPRGQVEKAFIPILQELQNVRVRGL